MKIYSCFLSLAFLAIFSSITAQDAEEKNDKIHVQKVAFLTERMHLTSKEAEVFWPVYNEYQEKKDKIAAQRKEIRENYKQNSLTLTDNQANDILNRFVSIEQQDLALFTEYNEKFKKVLPAKKVIQLYIAENQFKAWLISKLRNPVGAGNEGRRK